MSVYAPLRISDVDTGDEMLAVSWLNMTGPLVMYAHNNI